MTKSCSVKRCKSGRNTDRKLRASNNFRQMSLFQLPKCPIKRQEWCKILSIEPTLNTVVCELHFDDNDIIMEDSFIINGVKKTIPRTKYTLKPDAMPIPKPRHAAETPREILEPSNLDETSLDNSEQFESEDSALQPGQSLLKQSTRKQQFEMLMDQTVDQLTEDQQSPHLILQPFRKILPKPNAEEQVPKQIVFAQMPAGKPLLLGTLSSSSGQPLRPKPLILQPMSKICPSVQSQPKQVILQSASKFSSLVHQSKQVILQSAKEAISKPVLQLQSSQSSLLKLSPRQLLGKSLIQTPSKLQSSQPSNKSDGSEPSPKKTSKRYTIKLVKPAPSKLMIDLKAQNKSVATRRPRILRQPLSKLKSMPLQLIIVRNEKNEEKEIRQENEELLEAEKRSLEEMSESAMEIPLEIHEELEQKQVVDALDYNYEQHEQYNGLFSEEQFRYQTEELLEREKRPLEEMPESAIEIPLDIHEELDQKHVIESLDHNYEQYEQLSRLFSEEEYVDHEELSDGDDGLKEELQKMEYDQEGVNPNYELVQVLREKLQKKLQSFREQSCQVLMQQQQSDNMLQESVQEQADCDMNSDSAFYSTDESPQKAVLTIDTIIDSFKMLPESWCYVVNESVITFIYFNRYNFKERIRLKITSELCVLLSVGGIKDIDLNDRIESIDDLYIYFKLVEDSEVCSGTGVDCDKYSIECNGILSNNERYQRQQTFPRCRACRLLRQRIQSKISYYQNTRFKKRLAIKRKRSFLEKIKKEIKEEKEEEEEEEEID